MSDTPRTFKMIAYAPTGLKINPAFNQAVDLCEQLEIELNAAKTASSGWRRRETGWRNH